MTYKQFIVCLLSNLLLILLITCTVQGINNHNTALLRCENEAVTYEDYYITMNQAGFKVSEEDNSLYIWDYFFNGFNYFNSINFLHFEDK